jgi:hypothetical protein
MRRSASRTLARGLMRRSASRTLARGLLRRGARRTLARGLLRALPRRQLGLGVLSALAIVALLDRTSSGADALQAGALTLSLALAAILDDPAAETAGATPPSLLVRRALTLALALPVVAIAWLALVWIGAEGSSRSGALTLQLAALVLVTLALATVLPHGSQLAGPLVVLTFLTGLAAAGASTAVAWTLAPHPGDERWIATWAAVSATAGLALLLASRDPARRPRRRASTALDGA